MEILAILFKVEIFVQLPIIIVKQDIDFKGLQYFPSIHSLLQNLLNNQSQCEPRQFYPDLNGFIAKQQDILGPKKFKSLINGIFYSLIQHSYKQLLKNKIKSLIVNLTCFQKYCHRYVNPFMRSSILIIFMLCNMKMHVYTAIQQKMFQCRNIIRSELDRCQAYKIKLMCDIIEGILIFQTDSSKLALNKFSQLINKLIIDIKKNTLSKILASALCIVSYYLSRIYQLMSIIQLSSYHITKCLEIATQYLANSEQFINVLKKQFHYSKYSTIKLTHIQYKMQQIKIKKESIQSIKVQNKCLFQPIKQNQQKLKKQRIFQQLQNIFIIKQKNNNYYKIKKQRIKKYAKNKIKIQLQIKQKLQKLKQIQKQKQQLQQHLKLQKINKNIKQYQNQQQILQKQIQLYKWNYLSKINQVKKINKYILSFKQQIQYLKINRIYYNISIYNNISHVVEIYFNFNQYKMHVYQTIQSQNALNVQIQITKKECQQLIKHIPFYYIFTIGHTKIQRLTNQITNMKPKQLYNLKNIFIKYKIKRNIRLKYLHIQKSYFNINYGSNFNRLKILILVYLYRFKEQNVWKGSIQRIDCSRYKNECYNFKLLKNISNCCQITNQQLQKVVYEKIHEKLNQKFSSIHVIYNFCKKIVCKSILSKKRFKNNIKIFIQGQYIYTLFNEKLFIQSLIDKDIAKKARIFFKDLQFVKTLQHRLNGCKAEYQMEIIQKYLRIKYNAHLIFQKMSPPSLYKSNFENKLCFYKKMEGFIYQTQVHKGLIMYMVSKKQNIHNYEYYLLRIFNLNSQSMIKINVQVIINYWDKIFLQLHLYHINDIIDINGKNKIQFIKNKNIIKNQHQSKQPFENVQTNFQCNSNNLINLKTTVQYQQSLDKKQL